MGMRFVPPNRCPAPLKGGSSSFQRSRGLDDAAHPLRDAASNSVQAFGARPPDRRRLDAREAVFEHRGNRRPALDCVVLQCAGYHAARSLSVHAPAKRLRGHEPVSTVGYLDVEHRVGDQAVDGDRDSGAAGLSAALGELMLERALGRCDS